MELMRHSMCYLVFCLFFFFQAEDGIRDLNVTGVQTCALPIFDRKPKFVFAPSADAVPGAIPFDMLDAEFSHHGNYCTFETLMRRFAISDKVIAKIGEMIHDADLDDARFQRVEAVGIDRVLKGWAKQGLPDKEILRRGFECFDALYAFLQRR